jgi:hypothetical protein
MNVWVFVFADPGHAGHQPSNEQTYRDPPGCGNEHSDHISKAPSRK